ncbi:hypothetical protein V6N13_003030 [Hibiscus sabdariffa]|uniref:Uncharacterized protein n=1 Tax=Hibiscus sabdariffa TaxID=183260 RepID=A0ABR2NDE8_9ROSI
MPEFSRGGRNNGMEWNSYDVCWFCVFPSLHLLQQVARLRLLLKPTDHSRRGLAASVPRDQENGVAVACPRQRDGPGILGGVGGGAVGEIKMESWFYHDIEV